MFSKNTAKEAVDSDTKETFHDISSRVSDNQLVLVIVKLLFIRVGRASLYHCDCKSVYLSEPAALIISEE
jgi:hypothetical protein